jgi:hypothetical protein
MFLVLMIIVSVSAAGVFVANASSLELRSAGFVRQAGQTHYVTEAGASSALARMRGACRSYFTDYLRRQALLSGSSTSTPAELRDCPRVTTYVTPPGGGSRVATPVFLPCYTFLSRDFTTPMTFGSVFQSASGTYPRTEGSLGTSGVQPVFRVVVTELGTDVSPTRGADQNQATVTTLPTRYEIASQGVTELDRASYGADLNNVARGDESLRAIAVLQCN